MLMVTVLLDCSPAVGWCSGEALSFHLSTYQQENSLILLPFVQHISGRKGQAGRVGREMEHDKVSTAFWSLFLHMDTLLLPAGVCCAAGTWAWTWVTSGSGFRWLILLALSSLCFVSIQKVVSFGLRAESQGCSKHPWGRLLGGRGEERFFKCC